MIQNPRKRNNACMSEETSSSNSISDSLTSNSKFAGIGNGSDNWMKLKLKKSLGNEEDGDNECGKMEMSIKNKITDLGNGSEVIYYPTFIDYEEGWRLFDYLNSHIPWTRPTLRVFGRHCVQPRDSCYVAEEGVAELGYSGHKPHAYSWHQFPPLVTLLKTVEEGIPGSHFNSLLLNRYKNGNDYVGWHSDDETIYGSTPLIASVSFGCDRPFYLKLKKNKSKNKNDKNSTSGCDQHSFNLKHGSLFVMRGYTQRDWIHSVPKRAKLDAVRINLTFRLVL